MLGSQSTKVKRGTWEYSMSSCYWLLVIMALQNLLTIIICRIYYVVWATWLNYIANKTSWSRHWIPNPEVPCLKPLGGSKLTQSFILLRSIKWVPGISGNLKVKTAFSKWFQPWGSWIPSIKRGHKVFFLGFTRKQHENMLFWFVLFTINCLISVSNSTKSSTYIFIHTIANLNQPKTEFSSEIEIANCVSQIHYENE